MFSMIFGETAPERLPGPYRVIALEGADGVGKTTVAHQLMRSAGYHRIHSPYRPGRVDLRRHYESVLSTRGLVVLDRCFVSEAVYGEVLRGRSRLTEADLHALAELLARRSGVLVHLVANRSEIEGRLRRRDGDAPDRDRIEAIQARYDEVIRGLDGVVPIWRRSSTDLVEL